MWPLWPYGLQDTRLSCPSLSPGVCSNSCPLIDDAIRLSHPLLPPFSSCPQSFPVLGSFPMSQLFTIRWPKYWSFASSFCISPSNEYSGLISFRIDWFEFLAVSRDSHSPKSQFENINFSVLSLLYNPTLTSIHDYRKKT